MQTDNGNPVDMDRFVLQLLQTPVPIASGCMTSMSIDDWIKFIQLCDQLGLTTLMYPQLQRMSAQIAMPKVVLEVLGQHYRRNSLRNLQIYQAMHNILTVVCGQGIEVIVLKGFYLAQMVYQNVALRPMGDVDILVRKDDLSRVDELLEQLGYHRQLPEIDPLSPDRPYQRSYLNDAASLEIEVHWHLFTPDAPFELDTNGLWARSRRASIAGVAVLVLSPEDNLLHLCLHNSFHHRFNRFSLRGLYDIQRSVQFYSVGINWDEFCQRSEELGYNHAVYLTLLLCRKLLHTPVPDQVLTRLHPAGFNYQLLTWAEQRILGKVDDAVGPWSDNLGQWKTSTGLLNKIVLLGQIVFPAPQALAAMYRLPANSVWILPYYVVRLKDLIVRGGMLVSRRIQCGGRKVNWSEREAGRIALMRWLSQ